MMIGAMNHPARDVLSELAWMAEMKLGHLDLTIEPPAAGPDQIDVKALRKALDGYGMHLVGHTAFYAPIGSGVERLRQAAVHELVHALEVFAELGAKWVNIHPDSNTHFADRAANVERNLQSLGELVGAGKKLGIGVMAENVPGSYNNAQQMAEILDPIPELGMLLDIGHTSLRQPDKHHPYAVEVIERLGPRIKHVHLHDNYAGADDLHLPVGTGQVPFKAALTALKRSGYDGTITLEVFSPDKRYFALSRDIVRETWDAA